MKYSDIVTAEGQTASGIAQCAGNVTNWDRGQLDSGGSFNFDGSSGEIELKGTTVVNESMLENEYWNWHLRVDYVTSGKIQWKEAKAEVGDLPTPWEPAPEDYDSKLDTVKSEIKQTTDAITTKINQEITDRQNEISRVDGAINANTAKINKEIKDRKNEITRVEGKIPTEIGGTNHYAISKDSKTAISSYLSDVKRDVTTGIISAKITGVYPYFGAAIGVGRTYQETYGQKIPVIQGKSIAVTFSNSLFNKNYVSYFGSDDVTVKGYSNKGASRFIVPASDLVGVSYITLRYGLADGTAYMGQTIETKVKVEYDSVYTDWSPAPEDVEALIAQKQDKLTAGTGIAIQGNVISATGDSAPQHDTQKEQVLASTRNTITIGHGANGTSETTKVDTNPEKVLEHSNLLTDYGVSKTKSGNTTKLGLEYTRVQDGYDLNNLVNGRIRGVQFVNAPKANTWYFVSSFTENMYTIQEAVTLVNPKNTTYRRTKQNGVWGAWREQVGDKSVIDTAISANTTKINQEITDRKSEITRVEGKIPTSIGVRNLWIQSKATGGFVEETLPDNHITGQKKCYRISNNNELAFNIEPDFSPRLYRKVTFSAWVKYENVVQGENSWSKFNCFKHELVFKNSSTGATTDTSFLTLEGFTGTSDWKYITYTYDYSANKSYDQLKTIIRFNLENARSGTAWVTGVKIEIGSIPSDYTPALEDNDSKLNAVKSEIKQTTDSITTKINQEITDRNSEITRVEGKIPTSIDTVNLVKDTGSAFVMGYGITNTTWDETKKQSILDFSVPGVRRDIKNEILPQGDKFFDFKPIKGTTYTQSIMIDTDATFNPNGQALCTWFTSNTHNGQKAYIKKVGAQSYQVWSTCTWNLENTALRAFDWWDLHNVLGFRNSGTYLAFYKPKLTAGNLPSDWSPAPEDYYSKLSTLEEKVAELQGKAYKKINIETADYTGYYSVYDGKVIKYDVTAKDGKYLDLRNFTFSDGKSPITGVTFDSNSLSVIYKIYDDVHLHKLMTYDNYAKFSINDQNKIVIDPSSTSQLLRNNLDKVTSFSYVTMDPNYEY